MSTLTTADKHTIFKILNDAGIMYSATDGLIPYHKPELVSMAQNYISIPDDIETICLNYIEKHCGYLEFKFAQKCIWISRPNGSEENDSCIGLGDDISRPVAIAEVAVRVYEQINKPKEK